MVIEQPNDRAMALTFAIIVHVVLFAALWLSGRLLTDNTEVKRYGVVMEASLIDLTKLPKPTQVRTPKPEVKPQPPKPRPSTTELERPQPNPAAVTAPQPELSSTVPKPDVAPEPKPVEEKPNQEAETRRQRDLDAEQRRIEAARLAELIEREEEAARAQAILDEASNPMAGEVLDDLRAQYAAAITAAIQSVWLRPSSAISASECRLRVRQTEGGRVLSVSIMDECFQDEPTQASIIAAVNRASPLPYDGFETVFNNELIIPFTPED
jgi:colicin import membrane protein